MKIKEIFGGFKNYISYPPEKPFLPRAANEQEAYEQIKEYGFDKYARNARLIYERDSIPGRREMITGLVLLSLGFFVQERKARVAVLAAGGGLVMHSVCRVPGDYLPNYDTLGLMEWRRNQGLLGPEQD